MGCWVRKCASPAMKRVKFIRSASSAVAPPRHPLTLLSPCERRPHRRNANQSSRLPASSCSPRLSSPTGALPRFAGEERVEDKENMTIPGQELSTSGVRKRPRRISNFASILADTLSNRTILHPRVNRWHPVQASAPIPFSSSQAHGCPSPSSSSQPSRTAQFDPFNEDSRQIGEIDSALTLPSDDFLDLFTYASSSPSRQDFH